jgi:hypothetical protein
MSQGFYGGYMGNAGALSDLVYRGGPNQMMPLPYYGGVQGIQQLGGFPGPSQLSTDVIKANVPGAGRGAFTGPSQLSTDVIKANIPGAGRGAFTGPSQLSTDVIEANIPGANLLAGGKSFGINPGAAGDARRMRKGLSPQDVQRLIEANPQFENQIREMYLPGAQGTPFFKKAGLPAGFDAKYVS